MKTIKWILLAVMSVGLAAGLLGTTGCSKSASDQPGAGGAPASQFTCAMHPDVVQDKPGKCPKCGMALTPKK